ncbi:putative phosphoribosylformylglycinamidine synthase [Helianthus annuus]|nr:putative phosphoribosylformylglycinamidine synthase [Helianthus annuus]KAJ0586082.1 putative phosphoribosylformylglycinamidine synthase [Helianthus annuus]
MASSLDITAADLLQGSKNYNFFLPKPLPKSRNSHLLFGSSHCRKSPSVRICSKGVRRNASEKVKAVVSVDTQGLGSVEDLVTEKVIHFFRTPLIQESASFELLKSVQTKISDQIVGLKTEQCFNIGLDESLSSEKLSVLKWLLQETYEPENLGDESFIGKDSLSMAARVSGEVVKAPGNLVISAYVTCDDITKTVTPDLKLKDDGVLLHVDLAKGKRRLGGSALAQVFDQIGDECPDVDDVPYLKTVFEAVQDLLTAELISAGHDISDGGLIVAVLEMAFAGNCGVQVNLNSNGKSIFETLFSEELGLVLEVNKVNVNEVTAILENRGVSSEVVGQVTAEPMISLEIDGVKHLDEKTVDLRDIWEETGFHIETKHKLAACVTAEKEGLKNRHEPAWKLTFTPKFTDENYMNIGTKPKVAIIREEGSNGDREMSAAFFASGFEPWDVTVSDLLNGSVSLSGFRGVVFVGGFSYADVLDSAKGWAASIRFNPSLLNQFQEFYNRPDTFSLGVCNGCQLMALLGWIPGPNVGGTLGSGGDPAQPRFVHNESGGFECRFTNVTIKESPAIMFKGMEGSTLGVWAAHGEGKAYFPDQMIFDKVLSSDLAPVRYCDDDGKPTETYPFNFNGSPLGVAAICSPDGRHLAMMPHPERCFLMWQFPWYPKDWDVEKKGPSPWLKMFQNAREWCS